MSKTQVAGEKAVEENVRSWLEGAYDEATQNEVRRLIRDDQKTLTDAFYKKLEFGTGGLRGMMGIGCNRINRYTIAAATQGLVNYLRSQHGPKASLSVLIGYDSRHGSKFFAEITAQVLAANGIDALIFKKIRPTPLVSFGCRYKKCAAAIMITASHNPPQYNGYKLYWSDGAQVLPPHDKGIIAEVEKIASPAQVEVASLDDPHIRWLGNELDLAYLEATAECHSFPLENAKHGGDLKIVYTSLHGTGQTLIPDALADWGFTNVELVEDQCHPDGDFPTVISPNPEERSALTLGIEQMIDGDADLLLATDPDADRVGIAVMHEGEPVQLTGSEVACICLDHICHAYDLHGTMPANPAAIKTIVTSELFRVIAESYDVACFDVLTGFKYIGELMTRWETDGAHNFVFGAEESYGYLVGTHARDKDAVIMCALIAEATLEAKLRGHTLIEHLHHLYEDHGVYREKLKSLTYKGKEGVERMNAIMATLRATPPTNLHQTPITSIEDYLTGEITHLPSGKQERLNLPKSNVLRFWLEDGSKVVIRPSGTEPKIKLYAACVQHGVSQVPEAIEHCDGRVDALIASLEELF